MIIAERSSLEGTRGRLDTCVIVVKLQIQTRAIQTQMRNKNGFLFRTEDAVAAKLVRYKIMSY